MPLSDQDFSDIADQMANSVLGACRAQAILFSFATGETGRRGVFSYGHGDQADLISGLDRFSRAKLDTPRATEPGGIDIHRQSSGEEYVFVHIPLQGPHRSYGAMALAISRKNWSEQRAFSACAQVAHMVSMTLSAAHARCKLEQDLAALSRRTQVLQRKTEIDTLTSLENKSSFEARAKARLNRSDNPAALIVIDLDFFKEVNDQYGHQFGDSYLRAIARAIRESLPNGALAGRIGGDEFAALIDLPAQTGTYIACLLARLRANVERQVAELGQPNLGRLSIGGALFPTQAQSFDILFAYADSALYESKNCGRNTTSFHQDTLAVSETGASGTAPRALPRGLDAFSGITAAFQPIVDLKTRACVGIEALARLEGSPVGGDSKALEWMFRDTGIAPHLTRHMLAQSLRVLADLPRESRPDLWVNLTKSDLIDPDFVGDLQGLLTRYGLDWDKIVVELHEDIVLHGRGCLTYQRVQDLRKRGAQIALDDFGSGYAGFAQLRDWPVDIVKIDQNFIRDVAKDPHAEVVIEALLMITRSRGISVVAEGIETRAQAEKVRALGCDAGQGYFFDAALMPDQIRACLPDYEADLSAPGSMGATPTVRRDFETT